LLKIFKNPRRRVFLFFYSVVLCQFFPKMIFELFLDAWSYENKSNVLYLKLVVSYMSYPLWADIHVVGRISEMKYS